ncbi:M57 family metalloprotease [Nocardioides sp.]|uniref:M57 family metalloprotease n=1 Tax=Nocardioides sp. TaxID=35761 RepID=UPI002D7F2B41|nr:M57 family metalloprotease [Nocardioides sp.]HET8961949.1 M57 family metalloprotease [Nocardioides sp.]
MNTSRIGRVALAATGVLALGLSGLTIGAAEGSEAPSYQEFKASTFRDVDRQYIVNGDEPATTDGDLRQFYKRMMGPQKSAEDGLIVNRVNGQDDKWSASQALNLTYCVSTKFGSNYGAVVNATAAGAGLWENASSKVEFTHLPAHDANCTTRNNAVLFSVEPTSTTQYIARAFFPSSPDRSRNVLVNAVSLQNSGNWEPGDIMSHELGHTLGFRHEHTRPESGTCFEDNNWRPLTPYDSVSIMHYPQCNGGSSDLEFSANDGNGVRALYGA